MTWLAPWAFAAAALLAGPVLVHMLLRRHARRFVFPATHFLVPTHASAVRFRRPSDVGLLLLRLLIVAAAVAAAARPVFVTRWRIGEWEARTSRAVVVDTSRGMASPDIAAGLAQQEMAGAFHARRFDGADLRDTVDRAGQWIAGAPPSRREVVVISDFQRGSIDADALGALPEGVGVRLVRAGSQPPQRSVTPPPVDGWRGATWQPASAIEAEATRTTWTRQGDVDPPSWVIPVVPAEDGPAADRALRAAASFGVAAGDAGRRVAVIFAGGRYQGSAPQPVRTPWMVPAVLALRDSRLLRETGIDVSTAESDGTLIVETSLGVSSPSAPALLRAAMLAMRPAPIVDTEAETVTVPDAELARWRRDPVPVNVSADDLSAEAGYQNDAEKADARWLWTAALVLLGIEAWVRRSSRRQNEQVVHADAA
jgi:hypothetical protein